MYTLHDPISFGKTCAPESRAATAIVFPASNSAKVLTCGGEKAFECCIVLHLVALKGEMGNMGGGEYWALSTQYCARRHAS